jgi:alanyl-tRNA synthetase
MQAEEVRKKYLDFFKERGHVVIPSSSLVPEGDITTLFTGSGMQPLIKYLLGKSHPLGRRLTDSQKCFRAEDIDEVGDNRHTTFFEMLGNWSLGDYFKEEQLQWFFEFLTEPAPHGVGLDPKRLYVSVFSGAPEYGIPKDDESAAIWQKLFAAKGIEAKAVMFGVPEKGGELGMQGGRIFYYNSRKNWWSRSGPPEKMPPREPGGPDSEVFYDFFPSAGSGHAPLTSLGQTHHDPKFGKYCHPNCECGRFMEIGNSVFMEYKKNEDGTFSKLAQRNVDFGGGLERITAASNNDPDIFNIDILKPLITQIRAGAKNSNIKSERIIADHVRAAVFLIGDGVIPSNKDRGYMLRRLIRRAVIHAQYLIGLAEGFLSGTINTLIDSYAGAYPELVRDRERINEAFKEEQVAFERTYQSGIKEFEKVAAASGQISGTDAFTLLATHGFPIELTEELAARMNKTVDRRGFEKEIERHREISRAGVEKKFGGHGLILDTGELKAGDPDEIKKVTRLHTATHLLNQALHDVLGDQVDQRGSDITAERCRFDFTFGRKLTAEELSKVERIVNEKIKEDLPVQVKELPLEEAIRLGARRFYKGHYPPNVKVYYIGKADDIVSAYSKELCGGPHVRHTGEIGSFKIIKEESSSAGIRRIRADVS